MTLQHKVRVHAIGHAYDGVMLWGWICPLWNHGYSRNCGYHMYGSWELAVKYAIKHAVTDGGNVA